MVDPKLTQAKKEIAAVLSKHGLCGIVFVASKRQIIRYYHFNAPWSSLIEKRGGGFAIECSCDERKGPAEENATRGLLAGIIAVCRDTERLMEKMADEMGYESGLNCFSYDVGC